MLPLEEFASFLKKKSILLTIRVSVFKTTVEHPMKYHQKIFQIILEDVFKDVTVSIGSLTP